MRRTRRPNRSFHSALQASVVVETLERRQLLSAVIDPSAHPTTQAEPQAGFQAGSATKTGYSPDQIRSAYGISGISFNGVTGTGAGQTIAIIVAHDNPKLVNSTDSAFSSSDLHSFDAAYGLSDPPSFRKIDQNGGSSYPTEDPGWANEAALDVEWTHVIAPQANIVLVEASSTNLSDLIDGAAAYAAIIPGVSAITMSFAVNEFYGESSYDAALVTPSGHSGVTFLAASGDNADVGGYPAYSPNVIAVGGTTLNLSGNNYSSETGLNTSGGGKSTYEPKPAYQFAQPQYTVRTIPDVSIEGDKNTGVSVYDSLNGGTGAPWYKIGGTSAGTPIWAGLVAIANQGRASIGLGALDGVTQTLPRLYSLNSADFHDITSGNNGLPAGPGYDLVTGIGTPIANKLVPDLAGGNKIAGTIFSDTNANASLDSGESGLSDYTAYIDLYSSGTNQGVDPSVVSGANGQYQFTDLAGGTYRLSQTVPPGVDLTTSAYQSVTVGFNSNVAGKNIGYKPTGAVSKLGFGQQPTAVIVGTVINPAITVDVEDASGGIVTSDNSSITLSVASGGGSLGGTLTVNAVNGVATFTNITVTSTGSESLRATDGSLSSATSNTFTVKPVPPVIGAASQIAFSQQPFSVTAGSVITPSVSVQVLDANGNLVDTDTSVVTLTIGSGPAGAVLGGTFSVAAVAGVATFTDITLSLAGTYTLHAADGALSAATSASFTVIPVIYIPSKLVIAQSPISAYLGTAISPPIIVNVEDANGVLVTTDSSPVTLAIATGPTGAKISGTLTVNAVNGVATFSDITVSDKGSYTFTATDGTLTPDQTPSFPATIKGTLAPSIIKNTLPGSVVGGAKIKGSVTIDETNLATADATGVVVTNIYASGNGTMVLLGKASKRMKVGVKKTYLVSVPVKLIPASLNGSYSLVASVTDPEGNSNTSLTGGTVLVAAPFVALTPTITKLTLAPAVVGGSKTSAVAVIKIANSGNVPSTGTTVVGIYASPDGTNSNTTLINSISKKFAIRADGFITVTVPLKQLPASLNGTFKLLAMVTDPKSVVTTAPSATAVTFAPPFVAFNTSSISVTPSTVAIGKTVSMSVTVQNTGNIPATGPATIVLGVSSDGLSQLSQLTTITRPVSIAPGKTTILHLKFSVFVSVAAGSYYPFVTYTQDNVTTHGSGTDQFTITG